jgi:hypothetical protein
MDKAWDTLLASVNEMTLLPFKDKPWYNQLYQVFENVSSLQDIENELDPIDFLAFKRDYERIKPQHKKISELRNEMGWVKAFMPRIREEGEWVVRVYDDQGNVLHSERIGTKNQAATLKQNLQLNPKWAGMEIKEALEKATPESIFQQISDAALEQFVAKASNKLVERQELTEVEGEALTDALTDTLVDMLKARGFGQHMIKRYKTSTISGYKTTGGKEIFHDYLMGLAGFVTKQKASFEFYKALGGFNA